MKDTELLMKKNMYWKLVYKAAKSQELNLQIPSIVKN